MAASENAKPSAYVRFQDVVEKARGLSKTRFVPTGMDLPDVLKDMGYDQWRGIRFKPAASLWAGESFSAQFFHPGFLYQHPVLIYGVDAKGTHQVPFSSALFDYDSSGLKEAVTDDHGFAGFRIHYPLNTPKYADELISFLGASYFRALGRDLFYGLSARGLAVNTAEAVGEEFPYFREFWIVHPAFNAKQILIYALLDSESVAGAYEFTVIPGEETLVKIKSRLFLRKAVEKLGIAPLTSMFFYGENSGFKGDGDFRPEVHDSDGLLVNARSGEWIWHPLVNPKHLAINAFGGGTPLGFGLLQRDTDFDHYQDLEARYDRRASVWVTPLGDWGKGYVELDQIPSGNEYNDNIVAYWVPEKKLSAGDELQYAYTLSWHSARWPRSSKAYVASTRQMKNEDGETFIIDFAGDAFKALLVDEVVTPDVWVSRGASLTQKQLIKNTVTGGWRLVLRVKWDEPGLIDNVMGDHRAAIEFRAFLKKGTTPLTETWSYTYHL